MELRALRNYYSAACFILEGQSTIGCPLSEEHKASLLELHPDEWVVTTKKEEDAKNIEQSLIVPKKDKSEGKPNGIAADTVEGTESGFAQDTDAYTSEDTFKDVEDITNQEDKVEISTSEKKTKTKKK